MNYKKKDKKNIGKYLFDFVFAVFTAVTVISLAVAVTVVFRPLYYLDIDKLNIPESSGLSKEECRENYDVLIDYNTIGGPEELKFPTLPMSETGKIHFEEVKVIFIGMQWLAILGVAAIIIRILLQRKKKDYDYYWMRMSVIIACLVAVAVGIAMYSDWEKAFETMHAVFFNNDYWIFDYRTDPVITILPEQFFLHCGIMIVALVIGIMGTMEVTYLKMRGRHRLK